MQVMRRHGHIFLRSPPVEETHMNIKPGVRLLAITPWLSTGCAMAQTQGITKTKIKLGSIQDLFGPVADFGKHGSQGMQLRVDGLNAQSGVHAPTSYAASWTRSKTIQTTSKAPEAVPHAFESSSYPLSSKSLWGCITNESPLLIRHSPWSNTDSTDLRRSHLLRISMKLSDLKIGTRLALSFGLVLVLILSISALSLRNLGTIRELADEMVNKILVQINAVSTIDATTRSNARSNLEMLLDTREGAIDRLTQAIDTSSKATDEAFAELERLAATEADRSALKALDDARGLYEKSYRAAGEEMRSTQSEEALKRLLEETLPLLDALQVHITRLSDQQKAAAKAAAERNAEMIRASMLWLLVLSAAALALGVLLGWLITRSITRPIAGCRSNPWPPGCAAWSRLWARRRIGLFGLQPDRHRQPRPFCPHRANRLQPAADGGQHGRADGHREPVSRHRAPSQSARQHCRPGCRPRLRCGATGRLQHAADYRIIEQDQRHHRCDRWYRLPDQHSRFERGGGGGARGLAGAWLRRGGQRSAQLGRPQRRGGQGNQATYQPLGGDGGSRFEAGGAGRQEHGRDRGQRTPRDGSDR